jgi:hypothetical protein
MHRGLSSLGFYTMLAALAQLPAAALAQSAPTADESNAGGSSGKTTTDAQDAQNPIANVISVPFQNNTYLNYGPYKSDANILVVQPVLPIKVGDDWNLISRWVTPIVSLPRISPTQGDKSGLGNMEPEFYFSPSHVGGVIWGAGAKLFLPTATDKAFGLVNGWGGGPAAVALTIQGPWVVGVLANNIWAGTGQEKVNQLTVNPFINYNLSDGWYIASAEIVTANWEAKSGQQWTVPIGGGVGRLFHIGSQAINARVQALDNVVHPQYAPNWQIQAQIQFLFSAK